MAQELTWRVVNHNTSEIMESNSLGVIFGAVKVDLRFGDSLSNMSLYCIDYPNRKLNLAERYQRYLNLIGNIKRCSKEKRIDDMKKFVRFYRCKYG